jgi:hypothetical protein
MSARRLAALALLTALAPAAASARSTPRAASAHVQQAPSAGAGSPRLPARSPSEAPLSTGAGAESGEERGGEAGAASSDALVSNGLGSPLCSGSLEGGALSAQSLRNCSTSGFVASAAPSGDFGLDVHIDTGFLGLSTGTLQGLFEDALITPVWTAFVWVVHALCVMLEWCFTLDLLDSSAAGGLGSALREMQGALTQPWLVTTLSIAGVAVLYNGLVRRRVAETIGEAALMIVMIIGGMWAIADPTGTVGALGRWANQASIGTLAVAARGSPRGAARSLGESTQTIFAAAIEAPWCFLEFGDVDWCRNTARLDPALRSAGLKIADAELRAAGCASASPCTGASGSQAAAAERSARLLREARSNGAIFLALPPNGPARNSINEEGSLLRTLCGSDEATNCRGDTAAEAEFRTGAGMLPRAVGLLFIVLGGLGMILLLCFVALRLLGAALFSLLFLLLAPGMVLAPALGDRGRSVFRRWLVQLLGAVVAKLLFSFLLGVLLAVLAILASLQALGWWTQWLLMSAFWWGAFMRRHHAIALVEGSFRSAGSGSRAPTPVHPTLTRRLNRALETRKGWALARWANDRRRGEEAPELEVPRKPDAPPPSRLTRAVAGAGAGDGRPPSLPTRGESSASSAREGEREQQHPLRAQLGRVRAEQAKAEAGGNRRRVAELASRAARVEGELAQAGGSSAGAAAGPRARGRPSRARTEQGVRDQRPRGVPPRGHMEAPDPLRRRAARLEIDREIALQREAATAAAAASGASPRPPSQSPAPRRPSTGARASDGDGEEQAGGDGAAPAWESPVMRDAREVEAGRKRQLGFGRP